MSGIKGFVFVTAGKVTFNVDWNKQDERTTTEFTEDPDRGRGGHPDGCPVHARSVEPGGAGDAAGADRGGPDSGHADRLRFNHQAMDRRDLQPADADQPDLSSARPTSGRLDAAITNLAATGQWPPTRPAVRRC